METPDQVISAVQLTLALGPLAVYFLGLGLVNSRAQPCLVRARADFVVLALALLPAIIAPVVGFVEAGRPAVAAGLALGVALIFIRLLPGHHAGWVIYNIDHDRCRELVRRACQRLGWSVDSAEDRIRIKEVELTMALCALPWLRNVSISFVARGREVAGAQQRLMAALARELAHERMLPSPIGASLVVIGTGLLMAPMWSLAHHADAIVKAVWEILFA